jgi:hypothetical protein
MQENTTNNANQGDKMTSESATNSTTDTQVEKPNFVPQGRVNEMTAKYKSEIDELKTQLDAKNKADKDKELSDMAKRGEQDKVIEQLKQELEKATPYREKYTNLENSQKAELLKDLPEDLQEKYANHDLDVVADISNAYKNSAKKPNMVNANAPVRNIAVKSTDVIDNKELAWHEKIAYFKNKQ